jgi:hypothetical protein
MLVCYKNFSSNQAQQNSQPKLPEIPSFDDLSLKENTKKLKNKSAYEVLKQQYAINQIPAPIKNAPLFSIT